MLGIQSMQAQISSAASTAAVTLQSKDAKLDLEIKKIDEMKAEAQEKYDSAMSAASTEMVLGIASGVASVVSAASEFSGSNGVLRRPLTSALLGDLHFDGESITLHRRSDSAQETDASAKGSADATNDSSTAAAAARDRRKTGLDSIRKLLDIIRSMNPQL